MKYKLLSTAIAVSLLSACGGGSGDSSPQPPIQIEENAPPQISIQQTLTINENSSSSINFTVTDPESDPTQVSVENSNSNFSVEIQGNTVVVTSNEIEGNIQGSFFIVASDAKNTTRQEVTVNVIDTNEPSVITFPEQITLDEEPSKTFDLLVEDVDSESYSVSFDYDKNSFNIDYDTATSQVTIDYVGSDLTETLRRQFDIVVTDSVNEVVKTVFITVYPTNDNPIINFNEDVVISEGAVKYYKLDVDDDDIGQVTYQFNTEINGINVNFVNNSNLAGVSENYANTEYSEYLVIDASSANISTNIDSFFEIVVKDTFEGLDEIIETKRINLTLLNQLSTDSIVFNDNTDVGISLPSLSNKDSFRFTTDLMKHSNFWTTHCFSDECSIVGNTNEGSILDLDENGWIKTLPEVSDAVNYTHIKTKVFDNSNEARKTTRFYVLFEGEGKITYDIQGQKNSTLSQPFMDVIDLDSYNAQFTINIEKQESNYVKNIKVIPDAGYCDNLYTFSLEADCEGNFIHFVDAYHYFDFHPDLINSLKDYKVLNLSNNLVVNNNSYVSDNNYFFDKENQKSWTRNEHGVPFSRLVDLANYISSDIALDIPVSADFNTAGYSVDRSETFSNSLISSLNSFNNSVYLSYGDINENFNVSDSDIQNLLNLYNSQFSSFENIIESSRRETLIAEINNNPILSDEEKATLIAEINNQEMVSTEEKILNIIARRSKEHCDYLTDNSSISFSCDIRGSFNDEVINVVDYTYNSALLNCEIYREYLKTQPDTTSNIEYWENNNCDVFFSNLIIEPVLGDYITSENMVTIGSWDDDSDTSLFVNFEQELFTDSTFEDSSLGAVDIFTNTLSDTISILNNYDINLSSRNFRHNYYVSGASNNQISESRQNMITLNTDFTSNVWNQAFDNIFENWINLGGESLILFNHVESNEDNGVRALQSNEDQETQLKEAVNSIFNNYDCWSCQ